MVAIPCLLPLFRPPTADFRFLSDVTRNLLQVEQSGPQAGVNLLPLVYDLLLSLAAATLAQTTSRVEGRHGPIKRNPMRLVLAICSIIVMTTTLSSATASEPRPNILFIAVDDMRCELGCYVATHVQSPNLDRLASAEGGVQGEHGSQ
jgi:hypothetical protein